MKPYRVKHVPTGLYYKPDEPQLSEKGGKIYTSKNCVIQYAEKFGIDIRIPKTSRVAKKYPVIKSLSNSTYSTHSTYLIRIRKDNINDLKIEEL